MAESVRPGGTYQTLDEQREKLSPAEDRFEMIPITKMVRSGVVFDVIGAILIVLGVVMMAQLTRLA